MKVLSGLGPILALLVLVAAVVLVLTGKVQVFDGTLIGALAVAVLVGNASSP